MKVSTFIVTNLGSLQPIQLPKLVYANHTILHTITHLHSSEALLGLKVKTLKTTWPLEGEKGTLKNSEFLESPVRNQEPFCEIYDKYETIEHLF